MHRTTWAAKRAHYKSWAFQRKVLKQRKVAITPARRGPIGIRDHRDAGRHGEHLLHARDGLCAGFIKRRHHAAEENRDVGPDESRHCRILLPVPSEHEGGADDRAVARAMTCEVID